MELLFLIIFQLCLAAWVSSDGRDRDAGAIGPIFSILTLLFGLLAVLFWLIFRPSKKQHVISHGPKLCPHCGKYYEYYQDISFCPNCGGSITNKNELSL